MRHRPIIFLFDRCLVIWIRRKIALNMKWNCCRWIGTLVSEVSYPFICIKCQRIGCKVWTWLTTSLFAAPQTRRTYLSVRNRFEFVYICNLLFQYEISHILGYLENLDCYWIFIFFKTEKLYKYLFFIYKLCDGCICINIKIQVLE